jgi:glycosyltransferase involved in cell wall biosynthesis
VISSKRIGIVANTTWNIYNFRLNVIDLLVKEGHDVFVMAPIDEYIEYKERFPSVKHIPLRVLTRDGKHPLKDFMLIEELRRKYKRLKLDIVIHYTHKPNIYGAIAGKLTNIPTIGIVTGLGYPFLKKGWMEKLVATMYRLTSGLHKKVIFENEDDRVMFIKQKLVKKEKAISIKGCGVNIAHFAPMDAPVRNGITRFTFIGRLLYDKGIKEFVQAASDIKTRYNGKSKFTVVGEIDKDNPSSVNPDELAEWVHEDIIDYRGYVKDVRSIISNSDCIVLPSYREAIARSLTESMAMGKPIIATETAGCREAIDQGENGFLVPIKDRDSLREAMDKIINMNNDQLKSMGEKGRQKTIKEFDDRIIAKNIVDEIYKALNIQ